MTRTRMALGASIAALTLGITACAGDTDVSQGGGGDSASGGSIAEDYDLEGADITVGSKEYTEQRVLGHIAIAAIEAAGGSTQDKTGITGTGTVRAALTSGEIDLYWEYTGTGWVNFLGQTPTDLPEDLFAAVAEGDAANNVTWIGPSPLNNSFGLAVSEELADSEDIKTMSDIAKYVSENPDKASICADSEFIQRDDGLPGVTSTYGMNLQVVEVTIDLLYSQIGKGCTLGVVSTTDSRIKSNELATLEDDKKFFVPYNAAVTARTELVEQHPDIEKMFKEIADKLDNDTMIDLNSKVDLDGEKEADVAQEWLRDEGFID